MPATILKIFIEGCGTDTTEVLFQLCGTTGTNKDRGDCFLMKNPGECHLCKRFATAFCNFVIAA